MLQIKNEFLYLDVFNIDKYVETRGYIYLLIDSSFPDYVKVGRAFNLTDRLNSYNDDKPFATCKYIAISSCFSNVQLVEKEILATAKFNTATARLEWFNIDKLDTLKDLIVQMESKHDTIPL